MFQVLIVMTEHQRGWRICNLDLIEISIRLPHLNRRWYKCLPDEVASSFERKLASNFDSEASLPQECRYGREVAAEHIYMGGCR